MMTVHTARFHVGQIVRHTGDAFHGVVADVDAAYAGDAGETGTIAKVCGGDGIVRAGTPRSVADAAGGQPPVQHRRPGPPRPAHQPDSLTAEDDAAAPEA